jgi:ribonuclease VapC
MIVDTSAVMAVIEGEDGSADVEQALADASTASMSTATAVELTSVLMRYGRVEVHREVDRLLDAWGIRLAPLDEAQTRIAQQAYRDYGRSSGHPARLNLGDCFSYALATASGEPLLFVGDDFARTDIPAVLPRR